MKNLFLPLLTACATCIVFTGCIGLVPPVPFVRVQFGHTNPNPTPVYIGVPFEDAEHKGPQRIPGKVYCAYYDIGGEGVAYHDATPENMGSGSYPSDFRANEGVDIGSTTPTNETDNSEFNFVQPTMDMPYIASTEPGEWTKYTVRVEKAGNYAVNLLHTANHGAEMSFSMKLISFWGNSHGLSMMRHLASPHRDDDPVEWRHSHHWNITDLGEVYLKKGKYILTLETPAYSKGGINYAWFEFEYIDNGPYRPQHRAAISRE